MEWNVDLFCSLRVINVVGVSNTALSSSIILRQ